MQRVGGVSRYFYENITRIRRHEKVNVCSLFCSNEYFKNYFRRIWFLPKTQKMMYLRISLEEIFLWINLKFTRYDLVHLTAERLSAFRWTKRPIVITIHDMIPELFYKDNKIIARRKEAIHISSGIICVSNNTKKDLLRLYPEVAESKITVIYHGYNITKQKYHPRYEFKYILFVGTRGEIYKNFTFFTQSIIHILKKYDLKLVCTGAPFTSSELAAFKALSIEEHIVGCGYVSESELADIYHYAECFVYPSRYEGFGIPILEAFCHQTPACVSNTSCFPEVGGNAVLYFNPYDQNSIAETVERVITDQNLRNELIKKGFQQLKKFSWEKAAASHIQLYSKILNRQ